MNRLKDRNKQIPNGYKMRLAAARWESPPFMSFTTLCQATAKVVRANPALAAANHWPTDDAGIEQMVESYQVRLCEVNGWSDYLATAMGPPEPPKILPPHSPRAHFARLAAGASTLLDWLGEGGVPVAPELAASRARVCAGDPADPASACPQNQPGDLLSWFTKPASELIRKQLEKRKDLNLSTPDDERINICDACGCPLKLKVHVPLADILRRIPAESRSALDPRCWILKEGATAAG